MTDYVTFTSTEKPVYKKLSFTYSREGVYMGRVERDWPDYVRVVVVGTRIPKFLWPALKLFGWKPPKEVVIHQFAIDVKTIL